MARSKPESALRHPLTLILGTDANVRLLREFSRHGGFLSSPVLAERSGLSRASVWSALGKLEATGIVDSEGTGRSRLYRLSSGHPLAASLVELFAQEALRYSNIRSAIADAVAAAHPAVVAAWIYGSVARSEDRPDSDLDLAIVASPRDLEAALQSVRLALAPPGERLGFNASVVGLAPGDVTRLSRSGDPWWTGVEGDALALLGPGPGDLAASLRGRHPA